MDECLIARHAKPVPRYTSYPTAPHFAADVDQAVYASWLEALSADARLSLYVHIPFCDRLCFYCGCNTKATLKHAPVARYLESLLTEIARVRRHLAGRLAVSHLHFGGGSPNVLEPDEIHRLGAALAEAFSLDTEAEVAVEIDPRRLSVDQARAFTAIGVNRVSVGVQDFAPAVQEAIGREQPFEATAAAVAAFRAAGARSVNIDLVYGLPHQTVDSVKETIARTLELGPDRVALFGYAHLPARLPHQRLIDEESLPGPLERFAQASAAADMLVMAGYVRVGLDHFAKPTDSLARPGVKRNFQGYTTDDAGTLIGFGASAIGRLPQGFVQNAVAAGDYQRRIDEGGLAVARGKKLSEEDRARSLIIEKLMCDLVFPARLLRQSFPGLAEHFVDQAMELLAENEDGLLAIDEDDVFRVTETGRPFVRSIASRFDAYLHSAPAAPVGNGRKASAVPRHSAGV
ncbi:MAG: oxygen-independent coproporphyrinogen III oxidase [Hyphomicrobiaceae bacterium]